MIREIDINEISDGKLYGSNDLVKADCGDCKGCHDCCCGMGESIVLDPLDVFRLMQGLGMTFEELLAKGLELNVVDGIILPNLKMQGEEDGCIFLDENGRCSIHAFRPGICRLFPLGRYYEDRDFKYFLQVHECKKENRTKVKVKKWIDTPDLKKYEKFVKDWHYFLVDTGEYVRANLDDMKNISMYILKLFYMMPYNTEEDFYDQFEKKLEAAKETLQ